MKFFLFGRMGNKRNEIKHMIPYLPQDIETVVEPFGGSFALSRIYYIDKVKNIHINDNDDELYELYTNYKQYGDLTNTITNISNECINENNNIIYEKCIEKIKEDGIDTNSKLYNIWFKLNVIRGRMIKLNKIKDFSESYTIMEKIKFTNNDYKDIFKLYQNDEKAFLFLDPPYLFSDNSSYISCDDTDTTQIPVDIKNFMDDPLTKCKIMLVINDLALLRDMFKKYYKISYNITYQIGKKKNRHMILCNY
jgi:site-specific DNA-adenine methylase